METNKKQGFKAMIIIAFALLNIMLSCTTNNGKGAVNDSGDLDSVVEHALAHKTSDAFTGLGASHSFEARWIDLIMGLDRELAEYDKNIWESVITEAVRDELAKTNDGKDLSDDKTFFILFEQLVDKLEETCYANDGLLNYTDIEYNLADAVPMVFADYSQMLYSTLIGRCVDEKLQRQLQEYNAMYDSYLDFMYSSVHDTIVSPDSFRYGALVFAPDCELMRMYGIRPLARQVFGMSTKNDSINYRDISDSDMKRFYAAVYTHWQGEDGKIKVLREEESLWFALMQKRASICKLLAPSWQKSFNAATWRMKKIHAVQIRNEFSQYGIIEESRAKSLLDVGDSYEKIYNYEFKGK